MKATPALHFNSFLFIKKYLETIGLRILLTFSLTNDVFTGFIL
jgi:hypothetical protein